MRSLRKAFLEHKNPSVPNESVPEKLQQLDQLFCEHIPEAKSTTGANFNSSICTPRFLDFFVSEPEKNEQQEAVYLFVPKIWPVND